MHILAQSRIREEWYTPYPFVLKMYSFCTHFPADCADNKDAKRRRGPNERNDKLDSKIGRLSATSS
jgi:hypothetical protein